MTRALLPFAAAIALGFLAGCPFPPTGAPRSPGVDDPADNIADPQPVDTPIDNQPDAGDDSPTPGETPQAPNPPANNAARGFVPDSVTLDINELPEDGDNASAQIAPRSLQVTERVVRSTATIVHRFHRLADRALALAARINQAATDPNQTQFEGQLIALGFIGEYKVDFAAFDFDGDGVADGSGNAVDTPTAFRLWLNPGSGFVPVMCGLITTRPSDANIGAGQLFLSPPGVYSDIADDVQFYVQYDRTNPEHQWNFAYVVGGVHPLFDLARGAARVDIRTVGTDREKTVRGAYEYEADALHRFSQLNARTTGFISDTGRSFQITASGVRNAETVNLVNVCVEPTLFEESQAVSCDGFVFSDPNDYEPLTLPEPDAANFPTDFPDSPTF